MAPAVQRKGRGRKALKDLSSSDVNISDSSSPAYGVRKEIGEGVSALVSPKNAKKEQSKSSSAGKNSFEDELLQLQGRLQQLQLEKEKTEELLKQRDELLKQKDEEIENRGKEHEKLQGELKKIQKLKQFKPTMVKFCFLFPLNFFLFDRFSMDYVALLIFAELSSH